MYMICLGGKKKKKRAGGFGGGTHTQRQTDREFCVPYEEKKSGVA